MFQPISRINDQTIGVCAIDGFQMGKIISGNPLTVVGLLPNANIGDIVVANCGHSGIITTGNNTCLDTLRPTARIGDSFSGTYSGTIISGEITALA